MAESSFTFRCIRCNKLLSLSVSRVGSTVACPKCGSSQTVPAPTVEPAESAARRTSGLVAPPPPVEDIPPRVVPIALSPEAEGGFAGLVLDTDPLTLRSKPAGRVADRVRPAPAPEPELAPPSAPPPPPVISAPPVPMAAAPAVLPTSERVLAPRRNDVILPRSALQLWSFTMLVALIFAFATGFLAGHFLWRAVPTPAATAAAPVPTAETSK